MTSKRSLWVDIKTNLKRRSWLIIISFLAFFFNYPVASSLLFSAEKTTYTMGDLPMDLGALYRQLIMLQPGTGVLIAFLAVMAGIHGFSYMYDRKKLDMYLSVPVDKFRRFLVIYLNGVLIFLGSYLLNLLLSFIIAGAMGADTSLVLRDIPVAVLGFGILFFAIYNVAILAVMMTGHLAVTILALFVFLSIDFFTILLMIGFMDTFFVSFFEMYNTVYMEKYLVTPFARFIYGIGQIYKNYGRGMGPVFVPELFCRHFIIILISGIVFLALALLAYSKKPAESAGRAMAFKASRPVVKVIITTLIALYGGLALYSFSRYSRSFMIFGFILGLLICHGFMEAVYDFDIKAIKCGLKSLGVSAVLVAVIYVVFAFDITGFDKYVPNPSSVDSVAICFAYDGVQNKYAEDGTMLDRNKYISENMDITDIEPVLELARRRMGKKPVAESTAVTNVVNVQTANGQDGPVTTISTVKNAASPDILTAGPGGLSYNRLMIVAYKLKGGKTVFRTFNTLYLEDAELLDRITSSKEYKESVWAVYGGSSDKMGTIQHRLFLDTGLGEAEIRTFGYREFSEAFRKDLEGFSFNTQLEELPVAKITYRSDEIGYYMYNTFPVYPSFKSTLALLSKEDYPLVPVEPSRIENIAVERYIDYSETNYTYNAYAEMEGTRAESKLAQKNYTDPAQISAIADAIYPSSLRDLWIPEHLLRNDYGVEVIYDSAYKSPGRRDGGSDYYYTYNTGYSFIANRIPDFIKEDLG